MKPQLAFHYPEASADAPGLRTDRPDKPTVRGESRRLKMPFTRRAHRTPRLSPAVSLPNKYGFCAPRKWKNPKSILVDDSFPLVEVKVMKHKDLKCTVL